MPTPTRFACDVMLGKTAKWLRMLGVDAFYDNRAEDAELKKICLEEARILLTKDVALHDAMPGGSSRLVEAVHPREQLLEIVAAFHLEPAALPPRCLLCNGELAAIEKERVKELVPPYVFRTQERFQRCCHCRKIYWQGTHLGKINTFIETIRKFSG
ncbi:MAG: Mut7-C RNAse domain-containing protein [Candidatus Aminicenantes bacterium]|nr:Mut7-C RNAse domain-containing protein [Candidatus Aminicenantes bacterium]